MGFINHNNVYFSPNNNNNPIVKYMKTQVNTYKLVKHFIGKLIIWADEDEAKLNTELTVLKYKNNKYILTGWLSGDDFEYEFIVNGEYVELTEAEQDLIFRRLEREIENERINANYNDYEEPYFYLTF